MRCLLCGYADDKVNLVGNLPTCSHCEREAESLCTEEAKLGMHRSTGLFHWPLTGRQSNALCMFLSSFLHKVFEVIPPDCKPCQVDALLKLDTIKPAFDVWKYGRREDSEARGECLRNDTPVEQPARIFPGLRVYIGDLDDAANVKNLKLHVITFSPSLPFFFSALFFFWFCQSSLETMTICKWKQISRTSMN